MYSPVMGKSFTSFACYIFQDILMELSGCGNKAFVTVVKVGC